LPRPSARLGKVRQVENGKEIEEFCRESNYGKRHFYPGLAIRMRSTVIVHSHLSWRSVRSAAAAAGQLGLQAEPIERIAARLAGGFLGPIDDEDLKQAILSAIDTELGELDAIKRLPGFPRAAAATLSKAWSAGLNLNKLESEATDEKSGRLRSLALLEAQVLSNLPPNQLRPTALVERALRRLEFAKSLFGPINVHGRTEMSPVWRPLLGALSSVTKVTWDAGPRFVPKWVTGLGIDILETRPKTPSLRCESCASPRHEAVEALRWARALIASGKAGPEQIAISAPSTDEWDDHFSALSNASDMDIHFVAGVRALTTSEGQLAAALAEVLLRGFGHARMVRLVALLRSQNKKFEHVPGSWWRALPEDAPLLDAARWREALKAITDKELEGSKEIVATLLTLIDDLAIGLKLAPDVGARVLVGRSLSIWKDALIEGPPEALDVTLGSLRVTDQIAPEANIIWTPASALAANPRAYVRLIGLSSRAWPRHHAEDPLLPNHIVESAVLEPLPVHEADRRDFDTIVKTTASELVCSRARRDAQGRQNGRSPLYPKGPAESYLQRARIPEHAVSAADRLFARPAEFAGLGIAVAAKTCWIDWHTEKLTAHDGLMRRDHPLVKRALERVQSSTSLVRLLRDPIAFLWTYGFHWSEPSETEEPLQLDALAFGNILHAILEHTVNLLEAKGMGGLGGATHDAIAAVLDDAARVVANEWEKSYPVPPPVIWALKLQQLKQLASAAISYEEGPLEGQQSWAETPFGGGRNVDELADEVRKRLPWDPNARVVIPGTDVAISGSIDRLDLAGDRKKARVTDYKSGKPPKANKPLILKRGSELQRCLYAYAVRRLISDTAEIETRLLYPRGGDEGLFALDQAAQVLDTLSQFIRIAEAHLLAGEALPGAGAADDYNDLAFALPGGAKERYFAIKTPLVTSRLSDLVPLWEMD
jgi:PD-(D/E)XK nuclease superfamily